MLRSFARFVGGSCVAIGSAQVAGGSAIEPGMDTDDPTVDSHVRFMGAVFIGYGVGWLDAARSPHPDLGRLRLLAGLMAAGGASRLITRATMGRPHPFHDVLLAIELAAPVLLEAAHRYEAGRNDFGRPVPPARSQ